MAAMTVDLTAGITLGLEQVPDALRTLRGRLLALAEGLGAEQWTGPSRCHRWTAHEVLRHVRDACRLHVTGLWGDPYWPFDKPFDARATPDEWLTLSAGHTPDQTLEDLHRWFDAEVSALLRRLESPDQDIVSGPYAPIPWTVLSLHVFWDGWLHDRDVAQVTGGGSASTPLEDAVVATYALFIASMPAQLQRQHFDMSVGLSGHGQYYVAAVRPGHVELQEPDCPPTADLNGSLDAVVDSLAGRGPSLADVLAGDAGRREPLTWLRARLAPGPSS